MDERIEKSFKLHLKQLDMTKNDFIAYFLAKYGDDDGELEIIENRSRGSWHVQRKAADNG